MNGERCDLCKFFEEKDAQTGLCLRLPPLAGSDQRPTVKDDDWCGEYVAAAGGGLL